MKKKILSLITAFVFALGLITFSDSASAKESALESASTIVDGYEEYFRIDALFAYNPSKKWYVSAENYTYNKGGEYMIRVYKSGTKTVLFEAKGYIEGRTDGSLPSRSSHFWYTPNSQTLYYDLVVYRKGDIEVLGDVREVE